MRSVRFRGFASSCPQAGSAWSHEVAGFAGGVAARRLLRSGVRGKRRARSRERPASLRGLAFGSRGRPTLRSRSLGLLWGLRMCARGLVGRELLPPDLRCRCLRAGMRCGRALCSRLVPRGRAGLAGRPERGWGCRVCSCGLPVGGLRTRACFCDVRKRTGARAQPRLRRWRAMCTLLFCEHRRHLPRVVQW